jgi:hypothetical protein
MDEFDKLFSREERRELRAVEQDFLYDVNHGIHIHASINFAMVKDLLSAWMNSSFPDKLERGELNDDEDFLIGFLEDYLHRLYLTMNQDNPDVVSFDDSTDDDFL